MSTAASSSGYEPDNLVPALQDMGIISEDESSDHSSTTSEAESTNGTEAEEKTDNDHQDDKDKDKNDDEGHDGDDGVGCVESSVSQEFQTLIDTMPNIEHIEEHFAAMMATASNKEEYHYLFTFAQKHLKVFFDYGVSSKQALAKLNKEAKRQAAKEEKARKSEVEKELRRATREETITLNVRVGSHSLSLSVEKGDTIGSIRAKIIEMMKKQLKMKSLKKSHVSMTLGDAVISDHPRMTAAKAGLTDGCVLMVGGGLHGGAKRRSGDDGKTSFDDKMRELKEELAVITMRGQIKPTPLTTECLGFLNSVKDKVINSSEAMEVFINTIPVENLKKLQTRSLGTNTESKLGNLSKIAFSNLYEKLLETQRQLSMCERAMKVTFNLMVLAQYASEDSPAIQWQTFSKDLLDLIAQKSHDAGASSTKGDVGMK